MKLILGGHWTSPPDGWTVLTEQQCDITAPLPWQDNSVEAIFTEHVIEHISLPDAILFFKEAKRVLKPGGYIRTVAPFIDKLAQYDESSTIGRHYAQVQLKHYYPAEDIALAELGIPLTDHGMAFMFDSLLKKHNHKFVWTTDLMVRVLRQIGYSSVVSARVGKHLERTFRGVDIDFAVRLGNTYYDPESAVVEAIK